MAKPRAQSCAVASRRGKTAPVLAAGCLFFFFFSAKESQFTAYLAGRKNTVGKLLEVTCLIRLLRIGNETNGKKTNSWSIASPAYSSCSFSLANLRDGFSPKVSLEVMVYHRFISKPLRYTSQKYYYFLLSHYCAIFAILWSRERAQYVRTFCSLLVFFTQLALYPRVLYVKPYNKVYIFFSCYKHIKMARLDTEN